MAYVKGHRAGEEMPRVVHRFKLSCGLRPLEWLERGPDRCSRVRVPGGAALPCWGF